MIEDMLKFKFVVVKEKFLNNIMTIFIVKDLIEVSLAILEHIAPNVVVNGCQGSPGLPQPAAQGSLFSRCRV